jgi:hypothetical protein
VLLKGLFRSRVYIFPIRPVKLAQLLDSHACRVIKVSVRVVSLPITSLNCRMIMCLYLEVSSVGHLSQKSLMAPCSLPCTTTPSLAYLVTGDRRVQSCRRLDLVENRFKQALELEISKRWCASKCSAATTLLDCEWPHVDDLDQCQSLSPPTLESVRFLSFWG